MEYLERESLKLSTLRLLVVGGAACPRRVIEFYEQRQGTEVR